MKLSEVLKKITPAEVSGSLDITVSDVTIDSRQARPGSLFVAVKGFAKVALTSQVKQFERKDQ